jgi:5'-methylthioadenosine phosphorylase
MIDHKANVLSLSNRGVACIVSICSSGALRAEIPVPSFAVPGDFIDLWSGATLFDEGLYHALPCMDDRLMKALGDALRKAGSDPIMGGVYVQTRGPRLETAAEVRMLSSFGDYVGMNLGSEMTICSELGIPAAGLLTIDNKAHGLEGERPDYREIVREASSKWSLILATLQNLVEALAQSSL